jgi:hypothetical protein
MKIELQKFGQVLTSRPAGREAFAAIRPTLDPNIDDIQVDFTGVISLSPSWADEFFRGLENVYGKHINYLPSNNPSVAATLQILSSQAERDANR